MTETAKPQTTAATVVLPITGMTCAACQSYVERTLRQSPGVSNASVSLMSNTASVTFDPASTQIATLIDAVREAGYDASPPEAVASPNADKSNEEEGAARLKAISTLVIGAAAMIASMPLMHHGAGSGWVDHLMMRTLPFLYRIPPQALRYSMLLITIAGMAWGGAAIYKRAWSAALHRSTNMNTLVALGTGAAFCYSAAATFFPGAFLRHGVQPDVYYESVLLILGFLLMGNWLDSRAKRRTLDALHAFARLQPQTARVIRDGVEVDVPLGLVIPEDRVVVRPGERIPVDGIILSGTSNLDESLITGESIPAARTVGDRVIGGSLNYDGALEYRATSVGSDSVLGQMLKLMQEAQSSKAPTQELADRVSAIFVPIVLALAAVTFVAWMLLDRTGGVGRAFAVSVAVLVVACPCAMGLAVPAALTVAIGRGAQLGILFKGGESLERLARVNTIALDKTGTLTLGKPEITALHCAVGTSEADLLRLAASVEQRSEHPLARAVALRASQAQVALSKVDDLTAVPGKGVTGTVDGHFTVVGNDALFLQLGLSLPESTVDGNDGTTLLHVATDGRYIGGLEARDTLRAGAGDVVRSLQGDGFEVVMLTGDRISSAARVAEEVGISRVFADLLPALKLENIREMQRAGARVAMVGDGINDAAALVQADAGLAIGTGTDLAREAGDAILLRGDPRSIRTAIRLASHTLHVMRQNLTWALAYNLIGIPIAAGVLYPTFGILLSPSIASAAMALSSVSVLANSLRLRGFQE